MYYHVGRPGLASPCLAGTGIGMKRPRLDSPISFSSRRSAPPEYLWGPAVILPKLPAKRQSMYWSSRLVTLGLLSLRLLLAEELLWGKVAQGLVRTHCVIGKLPKAELLVQGSDLQGKVIDLIELLGMGTLCPFHGTIELGRARWQYEEAKASLLTRLLKAAWNSEPPSTCIARTGKGIRACRKRLAADTEVATGQRRILSMPPVMVQPLQSCFCQPADPWTLPITEPGLLALTIFMMTLF